MLLEIVFVLDVHSRIVLKVADTKFAKLLSEWLLATLFLSAHFSVFWLLTPDEWVNSLLLLGNPSALKTSLRGSQVYAGAIQTHRSHYLRLRFVIHSESNVWRFWKLLFELHFWQSWGTLLLNTFKWFSAHFSCFTNLGCLGLNLRYLYGCSKTYRRFSIGRSHTGPLNLLLCLYLLRWVRSHSPPLFLLALPILFLVSSARHHKWIVFMNLLLKLLHLFL